MILSVLCFSFYGILAVSSNLTANNAPSSPCLDDHNQKMFHRRVVSPRSWKYFHEEPPDEDNDISFRIVGGDEIDIAKAPYAVLYGGYCGGSLLAPEWVLTAAHCLNEFTFVSAGSTMSSEQKIYEICTHIYHPNWSDPDKNNFFDWDYQLLLLVTPVPVTSMTRPIAIGQEEDIVTGAYVVVSGWGRLTPNAEDMSKELHQVRIPIIPRDQCMQVDDKFFRDLTARMFCAGYAEGKMDACKGDSGGPAVINNKLVGLVSFGIGCAEANHPGVYTRIPMARPWLREVTGLDL